MQYNTRVIYENGGVKGEAIFYDSARVLNEKERNKTEKKMQNFYKLLNLKKSKFNYQLSTI